MNAQRMNWGKGLALVMIAFAGMMAYFVTLAARNPEPLITERYYEQELGFQDRIDARSRTLGLGADVRLEATRDRLRASFPDGVKDRMLTGSLLLLRANDARDDHEVPITSAPGGIFEAEVALRPGRYIAQLEWSADGVTYYSEEQLIVP